MKIAIDTNIVRTLIDPQHSQQAKILLSKLVDENDCVISYGTLFELFAKYQYDESMLNRIFLFLTEKGVVIATNSNLDTEQFYCLAYSGKTLSSLDLQAVAKSLFEQTSEYINNLLSELFDHFCVLYAYMKLNKVSDAYEAYLKYVAFSSNNFSDFRSTTYPYFSANFALSYSGQNDERFDAFVKSTFWRIISVIESRYSALAGRPEEFIIDLDWKPAFDSAREEFITQYSIIDYQKIIRKTFKELKRGQKRIKGINELFSYIDCSQLTILECDFINFYLKRLLTDGAKFEYNDIVDFMNLSIASKHTDCLLTLDFKFLEGTVSQFHSIADSKFYEQSLRYSRKIRATK